MIQTVTYKVIYASQNVLKLREGGQGEEREWEGGKGEERGGSKENNPLSWTILKGRTTVQQLHKHVVTTYRNVSLK